MSVKYSPSEGPSAGPESPCKVWKLGKGHGWGLEKSRDEAYLKNREKIRKTSGIGVYWHLGKLRNNIWQGIGQVQDILHREHVSEHVIYVACHPYPESNPGPLLYVAKSSLICVDKSMVV